MARGLDESVQVIPLNPHHCECTHRCGKCLAGAGMNIERQLQTGVDMEEHSLACVENLDSDLVCARGFHLDIFELEWLSCTPAYGSLALDDFPFSFRHDLSDRGAIENRATGRQNHFFAFSHTDSSRGPGPSLVNIISFPLNVLPKHLLQACKCLSLIRTIMIPRLLSPPSKKKKKELLLKKISTD